MLTPRGTGGGRLRRRSSRLRPVVAAVVGLLVLAGGWGLWSYAGQRDDSDRTAAPTVSCPAPEPTPSVVPAAQVRVNVYNATERRGLAARVAGELRRRGFRVGTVDNDPTKRTVTGAAEVRHSTAGAGAARTVAAQVGSVVAVPDQRTDATVDLALGAAFVRLQPPEAAVAALSPTPRPRPSGC